MLFSVEALNTQISGCAYCCLVLLVVCVDIVIVSVVVPYSMIKSIIVPLVN